jgi:hypothetical protein
MSACTTCDVPSDIAAVAVDCAPTPLAQQVVASVAATPQTVGAAGAAALLTRRPP